MTAPYDWAKDAPALGHRSVRERGYDLVVTGLCWWFWCLLFAVVTSHAVPMVRFR